MTGPTAFDADVLIYAAVPDHPLGAPVAQLFARDGGAASGRIGIGSALLLPEVLAKPMRVGAESQETSALMSLMSRLDLRPFDEPTARLALVLAVKYGLHAANAAHLATAVAAGAERFITNNRKDFPLSIAEVDVVYPDQLPGYALPVSVAPHP